jgi:[acyl-carrier-protein] S-malonyltransferase
MGGPVAAAMVFESMSTLSARRVAFVFPGQGSQSVGMGRSWVESHPRLEEVFDAADRTLAAPLKHLCWQGPAEELQLTANTQPAILTTSVAIFQALAELPIEPVLMAGHSLGEYSAHVAAGSLDFDEALRLVRQRGELMQQAVPVGAGAMAAVLGLEADTVAEIAAEAAGDEICTVANFNAPTQTVLAGDRGAVERAAELARERGARRAMLLPVSAPFHSPLMRPAREGLKPQLDAADFRDPKVPVVCNIDALPVTTGSDARQALVRQVDGPVRWVESIQWMVDQGHIDLFVEVGPGTVLTGLIRRIAPSVRAVSLDQPSGLEKLLDNGSETA